MFYARINKIKIFSNREGFLGIFNRRAELQIYSYVMEGVPSLGEYGHARLIDLIDLTDEQRKQKLLETVRAEAEKFAQSYSLEIDNVRDNQTLLFGESGIISVCPYSHHF
jgi:hypothetical protein